MGGFCKKGFSSVLGVLVVAAAVVALGATVYVSQNGTGFSNFASSRSGSQITITGNFPGVLRNCSRGWAGGSASGKCVNIKDEGDGKTYEVILLPVIQKISQYFNKRVKVVGRLDGDAILMRQKVLAMKIEVLGNGGGGGGQNQTGLRLKVLPTLALELGKINLAVSWNEALLNNPNLTDFRLNVRPVGGNWMIDPDSAGKVATKNLSDLAVTNGETYQVKLTMVLDDGSTKEESQEVSYVEDQFEGTKLSSFWNQNDSEDTGEGYM